MLYVANMIAPRLKFCATKGLKSNLPKNNKQMCIIENFLFTIAIKKIADTNVRKFFSTFFSF